MTPDNAPHKKTCDLSPKLVPLQLMSLPLLLPLLLCCFFFLTSFEVIFFSLFAHPAQPGPPENSLNFGIT